jgi:hypothetical protein
MTSKKQADGKSAFSDLLLEGLESSRHSLGRIEEEGEKLVRRMADLSERFVPENQRRHLDELAVEAGKLFGHIQQSVEENARRIVERLNIPTKKDLEDQIGKGLTRLNIATKADIDALSREIRNLRTKLSGQEKVASPKARPAAGKKTKSRT